MFNRLLDIGNYYFNPYAIPSMVVGIFIFSIGLFVLWQNKISPVNIAFFLQCSSVALWVSTVSFVYMSSDPMTALAWYRHFTFFGVASIMPSFSLLAVAWAGRLKEKRVLIFFNYAIAYLFYFLAIGTDKIVDPHQIHKYFWGFYPIYRPLAAAFIVVYMLQCAYAFRILYTARKGEKVPIKKTQIFAIIVATLIAIAASADFIPKFFHVPLYPYGYIPIFIYVCIVAYAIVRYKTFDIETAIHKTAMWMFSSSLIIVPMLFLHKWALPYIDKSAGWQVALWVLSLLTFALYLRLVQPKIDHLFQRRQSNLEEISNRFTEDLVHLRGLSNLVQRIEDTISDTMYPQEIDIFIYNEPTKTYKLANTTQDFLQKSTELGLDDKFLQEITKHNRVIHKELAEIDPAYTPIKEDAKSYFERTGAVVVIPLVLNDTLLGVINLGKKSNLKRYTGPEFHFLAALKNQATIAISNSLLYDNMEEQVKQRTKQLIETQKQLIHAEKLATVGTLAGGVAHEINNPLTAILTNVQMLLTSDTINDKLDKESLGLIEEATKRCRTIVQKLMTYARKPLETTEIKRVNLLDVLNNVSSFIGYQLEQENIRIVTKTDGKDYSIMGNQNELEQVLTNLILNSRDAIKQVKKGGAVEVSFNNSGNSIKIDVKDDGPGIPTHISSKIFDPFFTTKDVGKGVGLGLSICQAIVEKHYGSIRFRSEPDRETVFTIEFPKLGK